MSAKIQSIVEFLKANLHRKLTLDEIAQSAGLSRSRVCYLFKSEFDMSPGQYLKMLKMEKARELLEKTSLTVKEIRAKVGIRDQSHFYRDFKVYCGMTTYEYREHYQIVNASENRANESKQ